MPLRGLIQVVATNLELLHGFPNHLEICMDARLALYLMTGNRDCQDKMGVDEKK